MAYAALETGRSSAADQVDAAPDGSRPRATLTVERQPGPRAALAAGAIRPLTLLTRSLMINGIVNEIDVVFRALADPTRRRVVELLRSDALRASVIAERLDVSRAALSRHLRQLERSGLVSVETPGEDARGRVYRLDPDRLVALRAWLDQADAFWTEQLQAFKQHADRARGRGEQRP